MTNKPARIPEVRIYFSWLLYDTVSVPLNELRNKDGDGHELASADQCREWAGSYRAAWSKHGSKILPALTKALGVEFYRDVIDVPCTPWVRAISDPLTMSFRNLPDQLVDALIHELCHVLLTDNTVYTIKSGEQEVRLNERWKKLFGQKHDFTTVVHIPVHALCKYIYLDILKEPGRLERDMEDVKNNPPYAMAWEYVNAHDYHEIIAQLKLDYKALAVGLEDGTIKT